MEENALQHPVYKKDVVEWVTVSNEFCKLLEQAGNYKRSELIEKLQKIIPLLYLKTAVLHMNEADIEDQFIEKFVQETDWDYIKNLLAEKLDDMDTYLDVIFPVQPLDDETTSLSISECMADTYQDLRDFTTLYQIAAPEVIYSALWESLDNFKHIWGPRLLATLQTLHNTVYGEKNLDPEHNHEHDHHEHHHHTHENSDTYKIDTSNWLINQKFNQAGDE